MSSDQQDRSIDIQLAAITAYAERRELNLLRVYEDPAKSGLSIEGRHGMKNLLRDVMNVPRPFDLVLVYDVSRWGRFQDADAAAYYEYSCRLHGARVIYVQESFGSDEEPLTALLKTMKRSMAAQKARDQSVLTRAGQDRAIHLGFQMGQLPCIGLRKVAVERDGTIRPLERHQRKSMQVERIAWKPACEHEVELTRHIFSEYAKTGASIIGLARQLRAEGSMTPEGRFFTPAMLHTLLRCEALAGNFAWGRKKQAMEIRPVSRARQVIEPVIAKELWDRVHTSFGPAGTSEGTRRRSLKSCARRFVRRRS
jgi:DNA invertase Pin-like site-specific DNA recombinase